MKKVQIIENPFPLGRKQINRSGIDVYTQSFSPNKSDGEIYIYTKEILACMRYLIIHILPLRGHVEN